MMGDRRIVHILRVVLVTIDDHHFRQSLQLTHIEDRAQGMNFIHPRFKLGFSPHHDAKITLLRRPESIQRGGIGFGDEARRADAVVKHHHDPAPTGIRVGGDGDGFQQVHRPVGADRRRRTHRGGKDHRFIAFHRQIEEIRGFIEGVGAMSDHHAIDIIPG